MAWLHTLGSLSLVLAITGCHASVVVNAGSGGAHGSGGESSGTSGSGGSGGGGSGTAGSAGFFTFPGQMVLDGHDVVLTSAGSGTVGAGALVRTKPGSGAFTVLANGTPDASIGQVLAADAQSFYFYAHTALGDGGSLFALARSGGAPVKLADVQGRVLGLAVDATRLYWAEAFSFTNGAINAVPLAGGTPVVLATDQAVTGAIAVDASQVYWAVTVLSVSDAGVAKLIGSILSMPLAGGAPTTLVTDQIQPIQIVIDGTSLFWLDVGQQGTDCPPTNGQIVKIPAGGGLPVVLASNLISAGYLAVSNDTVYFSAANQPCYEPPTPPGIVDKVPAGGGALVPLATAQSSPGALVIDGASLYYTTRGNNLVGAVVAVGD